MLVAFDTADGAASFRVGAILGAGFEIFRRSFARLFLLAAILRLILVLPYYVYGTSVTWAIAQSVHQNIFQSLILSSRHPQATPYAYWLSAISGVVLLVTNGLLQYLSFQFLRDRNMRIGEGLARMVRHAVPIVVVSVLTFLFMMIGMIVLVVPGVLIALALTVSVPACWIEDRGILGSLARSRSLTKGYRGTIFLVDLIFVAASSATTIGILLLSFATHSVVIYHVGSLITQSLIMALSAPITVVMYDRLRRLKDGTSVRDVASVFD